MFYGVKLEAAVRGHAIRSHWVVTRGDSKTNVSCLRNVDILD